MNYSDNSINILTAKTYNRIGGAWIVKNLKGGEPIETIVSLLNRDAREAHPITTGDFEMRKERIERDILKLNGSADGVIAIGDKGFPQHRGKVKNSGQPIALFYKGDLSLLELSNRNIAVIGLRNPDDYTGMIEREVVAELVKNGAVIVSGLALGCDSIAHREALLLKGKTAAFLPSPLSDILPAANIELAKEIVKGGGLLATEYYNNPNSVPEQRGRYQERDRLQAMFSDCVILSASYAENDMGNDSGSRFAMNYASDYGIPRAVIYDTETDENNPKYDLNRQLIKERKEITVINREQLHLSIKRIIGSRQPNILDFM
ncbi:MAG: DNA-protecting protein DprA [Deferribacteraceae bacterium]|nr:DNA-protecting protein DprA [Deferribacteraceae bacterium]